jgi:hypothetical protein
MHTAPGDCHQVAGRAVVTALTHGGARLSRIKRTLLAACGFALVSACAPRTEPVRVEGACFVIEGEFWRPEFERFQELAAAHPQLRCLELRNSPGGATYGALLIGQMARERGMRTVARGRCVSACALAFLGGEPRELGPAWNGEPTALLLHGSFDRASGAPDALFLEPIRAWVAERTAGKMPADLLDEVLRQPDRAGGLVVAAGSGPGAVRLCPGDPARGVCRAVPGASAASLGFTTP